jgi:predicted ATP-dependent endonuclease of OLD family
MFFASQVLLVEGSAERVLLNYLLDTGKIQMPKGGVFVLDCLGKFNIHRFMNILGPFKVKHSILFDADGQQPPHDKINNLIETSKNDYANKIDTFENNIEDFLGVTPVTKTHRKPQHLMLQLKENKIDKNKIDSLIEKINKLIY